jgi:4-amino-4-deoxy-L-arabinose transferase-like glycosyltransferase
MNSVASLPLSQRDKRKSESSLGSTHRRARLESILTTAVVIGILVRMAVVVFAGSGMRTPWGGGGDTPSYLLLAQNLLAGKGYTYAGLPTAVRAPAYPFALAALMKLFGGHALAAMRWVQFFAGIGVASLCAASAARLFGSPARKMTFVITLFFPTLVEMNGEILAEALATFFVALFIYFLILYMERPRWLAIAGMGAAIGLGSLVRFNIAALGVVALFEIFTNQAAQRKWMHAASVFLVSILFVSPWIVRNEMVFHGRVLFSTEGGPDALHGVLAPQGRALPGDSEMFRAAVGWVPLADIETNDSRRLALGNEPDLDLQCRRAAVAIAMSKGWGLVPLTLGKLANFWLSTDQLFWTASFPLWGRLLRAGGVLAYLVILAMAIAGWFRLIPHQKRLAHMLLLYVSLVTLMHLPFVMSTRLRMPLIDPLLAALAGGGLTAFAYGIFEKNRPVWESSLPPG